LWMQKTLKTLETDMSVTSGKSCNSRAQRAR
jgi:hypothetical protein